MRKTQKHNQQNKEYNYLIIIVALVAIVAIIVMIYNANKSFSNTNNVQDDLAGMASKQQKDVKKGIEAACTTLSIQINIFNCKKEPMKVFEQVCKALLKQKELLGCK